MGLALTRNWDETDNLSQATDIDFSKLKLDYEGFRRLARNENLSPEEMIAFPVAYRRGYEDFIFADIRRKLEVLNGIGKVVVDIGCGTGGLLDRLVELCRTNSHRLILVDSEEMLSHARDGPSITKMPGMYPLNAAVVRDAAGGGADAVLCYSMLQYVFVDTNLFRFLDEILTLLNDGGAALLGDIPNVSKRKRFFSSQNGIRFHQAFMATNELPEVAHFKVEHDLIDDSVLHGLVCRAQAAGCHAYVMPQDHRLPLANRRDDLLLQKP